jgi:hypothetical protein
MPIREMNDDVEPPAVEGEMPTQSMEVAEPPAAQHALAADQEVDAELAIYLEQKEHGRPR